MMQTKNWRTDQKMQ